MRTLTSLTQAIAIAALASLWPSISQGQPSSASGTTAPAITQQNGGHAGHGAEQSKPKPTPPTTQEDHSKHQMPPRVELPSFIPPITDEDRTAAFPDVSGHAVHDRAINYFVLFDQLEWRSGNSQSGLNWNSKGWVGRDRDRVWFRTEGEGEDGDVSAADAELLYGRAIARWWEIVAGVRQGFRPGPSQTWAAIGIQGLAPYWFDLEATAYVGASGRTQFRFETEYEVLVTNRLILQPRIELQVYGKSDPERGLGAGLGSVEPGLRLRYEFRREFAPYIGVSWNRKFFGTADFARAAGEKTGATHVAVGLRFWL